MTLQTHNTIYSTEPPLVRKVTTSEMSSKSSWFAEISSISRRSYGFGFCWDKNRKLLLIDFRHVKSIRFLNLSI